MSDYGGATFDLAEEYTPPKTTSPEPTGPLTAIGWLACSPAIVLAAWAVLT